MKASSSTPTAPRSPAQDRPAVSEEQATIATLRQALDCLNELGGIMDPRTVAVLREDLFRARVNLNEARRAVEARLAALSPRPAGGGEEREADE